LAQLSETDGTFSRNRGGGQREGRRDMFKPEKRPLIAGFHFLWPPHIAYSGYAAGDAHFSLK
jgi:hypothetical protein